MQILAPHLSCVVTPAELQTALDEGYQMIYILTIDGIIKHHQLRGEGRYIRMKVDAIPGYTLPPKVQQEIRFLPAGKIPVSLFEEIVAFFRKVSKLKGNELEAMAHILWNEVKGYHIGIPDQRVSKASASYDWDYIPEGTSLVADIHSHNTMGAFFSGTDNNDDRSNICFSGVVGKITASAYETVWRFNFQKIKHEVKFDDIFDAVQATEDNVPQEWLDKVKTNTYTTPVGSGYHYGGNYGGKGKGKGRADHLKDWQFKPGHGKENAANEANGNRLGPQFNNQHFNQPGSVQSLTHEMTEDEMYAEAYGFPRGYNNSGSQVGTRALEFSGINVNDGAGMESASPEAIAAFQVAARAELALEQEGGNGLGKSSGTRVTLDHAESVELQDPVVDPFGLLEDILTETVDFDNPVFSDLCITHGPGKALLFSIMQNGMAQFENDEDLLKMLIFDQFQLLTEEEQSRTIKNLFEVLAPYARQQIEQNGL